jgi:hypothetical protein
MITMKKAHSAEYYTSGAGVESGTTSYYLDAVTTGEPAGQWLGAGAEALGLTGDVKAEDMHTLFNTFVNPNTGEALGRRPMKSIPLADKVAAAQAAEPNALPERLNEIRRNVEQSDRQGSMGFDATFAVPKSVTVVHTAAWRHEIAAIRSGDADRAARFGAIRSGIESAISDANAAAIRTFEDLATSRIGGGSGAPTEWVKAEGLTVASFFQHVNRSIDPHLGTCQGNEASGS